MAVNTKPPTAGKAKPGGKGKGIMGAKVGGIPVPVIAVGVVVAIAIGLYLRNKSASSTSTTATDPNATPLDTSGGTGGGTASGDTTGTGTLDTTAFEDLANSLNGLTYLLSSGTTFDPNAGLSTTTPDTTTAGGPTYPLTPVGTATGIVTGIQQAGGQAPNVVITPSGSVLIGQDAKGAAVSAANLGTAAKASSGTHTQTVPAAPHNTATNVVPPPPANKTIKAAAVGKQDISAAPSVQQKSKNIIPKGAVKT